MPLLHDQLDERDRDTLARCERFAGWYETIEAERAAEEQMAYDLERQHEISQAKAEANREWYRQFGLRQAAHVTRYLSTCRDDDAYNVAAMARATILTLAEQLKA